MKLLFMGTPDFAVPSLDALVEAGHEILAVYTQQDKPKGRKMILTPPPVKVRALELGLPVYQPASLKNEEVWNEVKSFGADCVVVAAYGKIFPREMLDIPRYGFINVHSSLLPRFRGAAPINWAILSGDKKTGVSIMQLDEGIDTGDVFYFAETDIDPNETAEQLHDRLAQMGGELLVSVLRKVEDGTATLTKQDESKSCYAPMLDKALGMIDWTASAETVHNKVRGLQPWPVASASLDGTRLRIHKTYVSDVSGKPGEVVCLSPFTVACGEGSVVIEELQADGGKRMKASDYFRGHPVGLGTLFDLSF